MFVGLAIPDNFDICAPRARIRSSRRLCGIGNACTTVVRSTHVNGRGRGRGLGQTTYLFNGYFDNLHIAILI
jgi:hypothetical protein